MRRTQDAPVLLSGSDAPRATRPRAALAIPRAECRTPPLRLRGPGTRSRPRRKTPPVCARARARARA
eukprot:6593918-Lingulodinium_polyedra.AAC.1